MRALIALIDDYRPGFADEVVPADPEIVEELSRLAGGLPGAYRRFLESMGGSMGDLLPAGADFNVEDRLLNYQLHSSLQQSPYLLIAAGGPVEPGGNLFMDRRRPYGTDDCVVVVAAFAPEHGVTDVVPFHAGLEELLYVEVYRDVRLPLLSSHAEMAQKDGTTDGRAVFEHVLGIAAELGFAKVPPAERSALLERGDAALVVYRPPEEEAVSLHLAADHGDELRRLAEIFLSRLPLRLVG